MLAEKERRGPNQGIRAERTRKHVGCILPDSEEGEQRMEQAGRYLLAMFWAVSVLMAAMEVIGSWL